MQGLNHNPKGGVLNDSKYDSDVLNDVLNRSKYDILICDIGPPFTNVDK